MGRACNVMLAVTSHYITWGGAAVSTRRIVILIAIVRATFKGPLALIVVVTVALHLLTEPSIGTTKVGLIALIAGMFSTGLKIAITN